MSNVFAFTGNLGRDAELKYTPSGHAVSSFNVANTTGFGDNKQTAWYRVSLWGKQAEGLANYLLKGTKVFISGELSMRTYTGKDGLEKTSPEVRAYSITLIGDKGERPQAENNSVQNTNQQKPEKQVQESDYDDFNDPVPF